LTGARSDTEPSRQTVPSEECLLSVLLGLLQSLHEIRSSILTGQASLEHVWPIDTKHGCSNFAGPQRTPSGRAERLPLKKKCCKHASIFLKHNRVWANIFENSEDQFLLPWGRLPSSRRDLSASSLGCSSLTGPPRTPCGRTEGSRRNIFSRKSSGRRVLL
jgi:hypothetical protein